MKKKLIHKLSPRHFLLLKEKYLELQKEIHQTDKQLKKIIESNPDPIIIHSQGKIVYANRATLKMSGLKNKNGIIGKPVMSFVHPSYHPQVKERIGKVLQGKMARLMEEKFILPDGREIDAQIWAIPTFYKGIPASQVIIKNISRQKQLENLIHSNASDLKMINHLNHLLISGKKFGDIIKFFTRYTSQIFASNGATVYILNREKNALTMQNLNLSPQIKQKIEKNTGIGLSKIPVILKKGTLIWNILQEQKPLIVNDPQRIQTAIAQCTEDKTLKKLAPQIQQILGYHSVMHTPLTHGNIAIGIMDMGRDQRFSDEELHRFSVLAHELAMILNQINTYEALKISEEKFRLVVENLYEGICALDKRGYIIYSNSAFEKIIGLPKNQLVGQPVVSLIYKSDAKSFRQYIKNNRPLKKMSIEIRFSPSNKSIVYTNISASTITDNEVNIQGNILSVLDLSQKRIQDKKREILYKIAQNISTSPNLDELLKSIHSNIKQSMMAENCFFALYDAKEKIVDFPLFVDRFDSRPAPRKKRRGLTEYVLKMGKAILLHRENIEKLIKEKKIEAFGTSSESWLGVPLKIRNRTIGVLALQSYEKGIRYSKEDRDLLMAIGNQAAFAIERKQYEERIEKQNLFLNTVLESLTHPFIVVNIKDYSVKIANSSAFGQAQPLKLTCYKLSHDLEKPCKHYHIQCPLEEIKKNKQPVTLEHIHISKDGRQKHYEIHAYPVFDDKGRVTEMIEYAIDITHRKQAENELKRSESRHRLLFEQSMDGIVVVGKNGFIKVNKAFCQIHQMSEEEILKRKPIDLVHVDDRDYAKNRIKSLLSGENLAGPTRYRIYRGDGSIGWAEIHSSAFDWDGETVFQSIIRDITDQIKTEAELQKADKLDSLSILAGGIAHDFNNLLTGILGNISLAKIHINQNEKTFRILQEAENAATRAKSLTQQLLTFAKGGVPIKKIIDIAELIKDSTSFALRGSRSKYKFDFTPDLWPVEVDEGQMDQVIHNLLINADMAMPEGGTVEIKVENILLAKSSPVPLPEGKYIKISIKDEGIGIKKEHLSKIFDPFFTTKQKGSGLGLATVYSIINKHKGHITVESELGVGTIFYIYLPATDTVQKSPKTSTISGVNLRKRVLIMEDEALVQKVLTNMLEQLGCQTIVTANGHEAIKIFQKNQLSPQPFDLIIMDLTIPGEMGGKETIQKIREIDPYIKAIVSSGYSNDPIIANYHQFGFDGYVTKPYKIEELIYVIKKVI